MKGVNDGLNFIFHIKGKKGHISNPSLTPLELNTELVYANEYAPTFMFLSPIKESKYSPASKTPLYCLVGSYCIISLNFILI